MEHDADFRSAGQRAGFIASTEGHSRDSNPWQAGTLDHDEWAAGWDWANDIREEWGILCDANHYA